MSGEEPTPAPAPIPATPVPSPREAGGGLGWGAAATPVPVPATAPHSPREALALLAISTLLAALVRLVPQGGEGTFLKAIGPTLWVLAWMAPAYLAAERRGKDPLVVHGILVPPSRWASSLAASLVLVALYVLGFAAFFAKEHGKTLVDGAFGWIFVRQVVFTALPEETFFRGALQPSLLPRRPWTAIALVSLVFALLHVAFDEAHAPARLLVFFPSLVFGWLRLRTGSVLPGIFFHALCNAVEAAASRSLG